MQKNVPINIFVLILLLVVAISSVGLNAYTYFLNKQDNTVSENSDLSKENTTSEDNCISEDNDVYADWKTYTSDTYDITVKYPSNWELTDDNEGLFITTTNNDEGDLETFVKIKRIPNITEALSTYMFQKSELAEENSEDELLPITYNAVPMWNKDSFLYIEDDAYLNTAHYVVKINSGVYDIEFMGLDVDNGRYILSSLQFNN